MKRILIVSCVYPPEPIVSAQIGQQLAYSLASLQNETTVITPYPSRPSGFRFSKVYENKNKVDVIKSKEKLTVKRLPSFVFPKSNPLGRLFEAISFGKASYRYIVENSGEIDKVYMNTWPIFGQLGVAKACRKKNINYVVHIQDVYPESLTKKLPIFLQKLMFWMLFPIEAYVVQNAAKIIVISDQMKIHIAKTREVEAEKINVVLNWQDDSSFERYEDFQPDNPKPVFMYLGNIGPVAGLSTVINSFIAANISAKLVLAGSGSKKQECVALAKSNPNIEFWDVPVGEVASTQAKADVLLLPIVKGAASSSIPSKLPAYMSSSRPIIVLADENSDTANTVVNAGCGWIGKAEDEEWLKRTLISVSKLSQGELQQKGLKGRKYCLANFSKEVNLNKLIENIVND